MTINTEDIIKSLFALGYEEVDCITFTYTLGKIRKEDKNTDFFSFEDKPLTNTFNKFIDFDGVFFRIKPGYNIKSIIFEKDEFKYSLKDFLSSNQELVQVLKKYVHQNIIPKEYIKVIKSLKK